MGCFMLKQYILKQFDNYKAFVYHLFTFALCISSLLSGKFKLIGDSSYKKSVGSKI